MFWFRRSKDGAKFAGAARSGTAARSARLRTASHKAHHKDFLALVAKAKEVRRESTQHIMRNPMLRDVEVRVGSDVNTGRIFQYNPEDRTYEVMLGGVARRHVYRQRLRYSAPGGHALRFIFARPCAWCDGQGFAGGDPEGLALDSMQLNGGSVG